MLFDKESLSPSYIMKIGRPGSSFAYEIATKVGLDKKILKYAKFKTGKNAKAIEDLLIELQSDKKRLEDQLQEMKDREGPFTGCSGKPALLRALLRAHRGMASSRISVEGCCSRLALALCPASTPLSVILQLALVLCSILTRIAKGPVLVGLARCRRRVIISNARQTPAADQSLADGVDVNGHEDVD